MNSHRSKERGEESSRMAWWESVEDGSTSIRAHRFRDELVEPIRTVLERHAAQLEVLDDVCLIVVPAGTMRQRCALRVHMDRYAVMLPDGYVFYEAVGSVLSGASDVSEVSFVIDEFPEWVQRKYRP